MRSARGRESPPAAPGGVRVLAALQPAVSVVQALSRPHVRAEGLEPKPGRGWHSLRRQFATELKHTPLKDLCALGGWKDYQTLLTCYQHPDAVTMRAALEQWMRLQG